MVLQIECQYPANGTLSPANGIGALLDKHRIAEAEEPVLLSHGLHVCVDDLIARGEGGDEHHERGARHMEVRDERVHHMEGRTRHEVQIGGGVLAHGDIALTANVRAVLAALESARRDCRIARWRRGVPRALEGAHGGGAHGDHAMAGRRGGVHGFHNLGRNVVALGVHDMLGGIVLLHQAEGVDTHLEACTASTTSAGT